MTRFRLVLTLVAVVLCLAVSAAAAQACTKTWSGGTGNWSEGSHWGGTVPGSEDEACINSGTVTISAEGADVKTLTVASGVTIDVIGTSWEQGGETRNVTQLFAGSASFAAGSHLLLEATEGGPHTGSEPKGAGAFLTGGPITFHGDLETRSTDPSWADRVKVGALKLEPGSNFAVNSGTLKFIQEGEGAYPWSTTNEGSFSVASGATVEMQPSFAGSATFTNAGSVVNDGSIVGYGMDWVQSAGGESGNPIVLDSGSTLTDSGGPGSFLGSYQSINVTGTIPAGQTVTVRGEPFSSGGETYNSTTLSTAGKELVNDGTLVLNPTGSGETGGQVNVESGSIHNNSVIEVTTETPSRLTQLLEGLTNGPGGELDVNGGILQINNGAPLTNEGRAKLAPTAAIELQEAGSFTNTGIFEPEIGAAGYGAVKLYGFCCSGPGVFKAGGTLLPELIGGYLPPSGSDLPIFALEGGKFEGTFGAVEDGFLADYSHESSEPAFVGVYRGSAAGGGPGPGAKAVVAHVSSISGGHGRLTIVISCPAGGSACTTATLTVTVVEHLKRGRVTAVTAKQRPKTKTIVIGGGKITLAAGAHKTLSFSINASGWALLARFGKLSAVATVSSGGTVIRRTTIHLLKPTPAKKKKKKK